MHCVAPASDVVPAGQRVQLAAPSSENVPAAHFTLSPAPSHTEPAGHGRQLVRVVGVPPDVNEPVGQIEQLAARLSL